MKSKNFGSLIAIECIKINERKKAIWRCLCSCGNYVDVISNDLLSGHTKSCGCLKSKNNGNFKDMSGLTFNRLTVLSRADNVNMRAMWNCLCSCGKELIVSGKHLRNKSVQSCGCLNKEILDKSRVSHGMTNTKIYKKWAMMKTRATNKNRDHAHNYILRGIGICDEWKSFESFYEWALNNGYSDDLTIERIDVDKPYCPSNCKWIKLSDQAFNKTSTHWIEFRGERKSLTEWAIQLGFKPNVIMERINRYKWSIEKALTTPVKNNRNVLE
ncbi:MAG: hypothetical protein ACRCX5_14505 [Bacteroidales bacterium]